MLHAPVEFFRRGGRASSGRAESPANLHDETSPVIDSGLVVQVPRPSYFCRGIRDVQQLRVVIPPVKGAGSSLASQQFFNVVAAMARDVRRIPLAAGNDELRRDWCGSGG